MDSINYSIHGLRDSASTVVSLKREDSRINAAPIGRNSKALELSETISAQKLICDFDSSGMVMMTIKEFSLCAHRCIGARQDRQTAERGGRKQALKRDSGESLSDVRSPERALETVRSLQIQFSAFQRFNDEWPGRRRSVSISFKRT